ncbi:MAG: 6-phosphogluconolactonase [Sphingomonadales bacterium]|nr:6-phosphogluconolactonase [Sphingomonadales bacterium]MDE2567382.1 6-phosphogluconolactonase [Sphingomonadales bacterium]
MTDEGRFRDVSRITWAEPGDGAAVADRIAAEVAKPGRKRIAVPGGSTPIRVFDLLAGRALDWSDVTLTLTDDRQVPDDHEASNYRKLSAALGHSGATIERLVEGGRVERFDLVWLGMGADGHIASLFPHMIAEIRPGRTVIATTPIPLPPEAPFPRLTLNRRALCAAKEIIIVITGDDKRRVIEKALRSNDASYPVSDVLHGCGAPVTIYWSKG